MSKLKIVGGVVGGTGLLGVGALVGGWFWVNSAVEAAFAPLWETHEVEFPIPFPLTDDEIAELREERSADLPEDAPEDADPLEGVDLDAIAAERAAARGKHYVESIYVCVECHGADFTGGTMLDDAAIGKVLGPNITSGSRARDFSAADWDRAVRHGVLPGGGTSIMPVGDFRLMSDKELADIATYILTLPPEDGGLAVREWGPMGKALIAAGQLVPDVYLVEDHTGFPHPDAPPPIGPTVEYGEHIVQVCTGCHRRGFEGGPMPFGPPDWPPSANLTPHADGLEGWTYEDFQKALVRGIRKNGENVKAPMSLMIPYAGNMTETELQAMWAYLSQVPAAPTGE